MKGINRFMSLLISIVMITGLVLCPAAAEGRYKDVATGVWYESFVTYVAEQGLMTGTSEETFAPNKAVTRAELVQTLYAMAEKPGVIWETHFQDLTQVWYKDAVIWATNAGVTSGVDSKHFAPSNGVTREQVATFLRAFAENVDVRNTMVGQDIAAYKDSAQVSSWALPAVKWAVEKGLLNSASTTEKVLNPKGVIRRCELAVMLTNYSKLTYPDPAEASQNLYPEILQGLNGRTFVFSSGAGAWRNVMKVKSNGTFEGHFLDSDAGGTEYDAVNYFCDYTGRFYIKKKTDENTYVLGITDLKMNNRPGQSYMNERIFMKATAPYGLENADDIYLYLPGTPTTGLPEEYKSWDRSAQESVVLQAYGLYNVNGEYGWYESENEF